MSKINVLSSKVFNRISAGEVVERPSSVVKELVENSIDANSTNILIEIENGGISLIRVADNGDGIEKSEIKKALLPHATSKIQKVSDLDNILSLGFRGEALASIASVSKITIKSKPSNQDVGEELYAEGGVILNTNQTAIANGTEIIVENLFFNTPVRAKFLKTERGEESEITSLVSKFILGNPFVSFKYVVDGKTILQSFGDGIESSFVCIYGANVIKDCFYIDTEKNGIKICGYIGKHYFTKSNRTYQTVFLNDRYIVNQTIASAIGNAYSSYLMKRQYPFYSLSISVPSEIVDVNVHPNKIDVRFSNNQIVYGTIYSIISKVLDGSSEAVNIVVDKQSTEEINNVYVTQNNVDDDFSCKFDKVIFADSGSTCKDDKKEVVDIFAENKAYILELEKKKNQGVSLEGKKDSLISEQIKAPEQVSINIQKDLKVLGQILNTYLVLEDGENLILIDQHAAHERILFDKLNNAFNDNNIVKQPLLIPFIINLNGKEFDYLVKNMDFLTNIGFEIQEFGQNAIKIEAIPSFFSEINVNDFFSTLLSDVDSLKSLNATDLLKEKIERKACRAAIKAGHKLSSIETEHLLTLLKGNLGLKCPHGRPIAVKISKMEIEKWFKRIV